MNKSKFLDYTKEYVVRRTEITSNDYIINDNLWNTDHTWKNKKNITIGNG